MLSTRSFETCSVTGLALTHLSRLAGQSGSGYLAIFEVVELEPHATVLFFLVFWGCPDLQNTVFQFKLSHLNYQYLGKALS